MSFVAFSTSSCIMKKSLKKPEQAAGYSLPLQSSISGESANYFEYKDESEFAKPPCYYITWLNSTLKSRDITLTTKVHLVNAMVFPGVTYGCVSWNIKKAEDQKIDALNCGVGKDS